MLAQDELGAGAFLQGAELFFAAGAQFGDFGLREGNDEGLLGSQARVVSSAG
jgi:hypothetical protein